jgi:hypothetical protein
MFDSVERVLEPGEDLRFEARPSGWPPLTKGAFVLYAGAFLVLGFPELVDGPRMIKVAPIHGGAAIDVPFAYLAIAVVFAGLVELVRFARYRSRVYAVTSERVLVLEGILRPRLRGAIALGTVRRLQLLGGEPAIVTSRGKYVLTGLDTVDLESIRHALGDPPLLETRPHGLLRRRFGAFGLVLALLFTFGLEAFGFLERRASDQFMKTWARVDASLDVTAKLMDEKLQVTTLTKVGGPSNALFPESASVRIDASGDGSGYAIRITAKRASSLLPFRLLVSVRETQQLPNNRDFLAALKEELGKAGIEVEWPEEPR